MRHISTTPFGRRTISAAHLQRQALAEAPAPRESPDKWLVLRELTAARAAFSVSDRDLAVLAALLSFRPAKELSDDGGLIVFPSNIALSGRIHGMPESTLRRHLANLVQAGLILRHDSPNGKRYALRGAGGQTAAAFGFDLRPLLLRWTEIRRAAETAREEELKKQSLRQSITLQLRDAAKLWLYAVEASLPRPAAIGEDLALLQRMLRRKLDLPQLVEMADRVRSLLVDISRCIPEESENPGGNDSQNERHIQNSETYIQESESAQKPANPADPAKPERNMPLEIVLKATPDLAIYSEQPITTWRHYWNAANFVRPMLGIDNQTWDEARRSMGDETAAVSIACMLQRATTIRRPGAYLRVLGQKAASRQLSAPAMVRALLRTYERPGIAS